MAAFGYGSLSDRALVSFQQDLEEEPWKSISTKKFEDAAKENAAALLAAPHLVFFKVRLRLGIAQVIAAAGGVPLTALDEAWDSAQRRLFHRIGVHVDDDDRDSRAAADRLYRGLLAGNGTAQTQFVYDDEVNFGRHQVALTSDGGPLAADVKRLKLGDVLGEVHKTTEALAKGLGRADATGRKAPSRKLREGVAECAAAFNAVHESLAWFVDNTPAGADRDQLSALLAPLERLLERNRLVAAPVKEEAPAEEAAPAKEAAKDGAAAKDAAAKPAKPAKPEGGEGG